jgi:hypothetical protein
VEPRSRAPGERGSATVEQAGLTLLIALALASGIAISTGELGMETGRGLGIRVANRIACGPVGPGACRSHPVIEAYGERVAKAIQALAPGPMVLIDGSGRTLLPVDFRYCRQSSCAEVDPGRPDLELTASNRRTTWFTEVSSSKAGHLVTWWGWWPGIGWRAIRRTIGDGELDAYAGVRVTLKNGPRLVPLEALDGRNHREFGGIEMPPWQWRVESDHGARNN